MEAVIGVKKSFRDKAILTKTENLNSSAEVTHLIYDKVTQIIF